MGHFATRGVKVLKRGEREKGERLEERKIPRGKQVGERTKRGVGEKR